jgi:hypothetical protein
MAFCAAFAGLLQRMVTDGLAEAESVILQSIEIALYLCEHLRLFRQQENA